MKMIIVFRLAWNLATEISKNGLSARRSALPYLAQATTFVIFGAALNPVIDLVMHVEEPRVLIIQRRVPLFEIQGSSDLRL